MDVLDDTLTRILTKISESSFSDVEKADIYARINVGLHHLVWPILLSHMPQLQLKKFIENPTTVTNNQYISLIESALQNPEAPKEIFHEINGALEEVEALLTAQLPKPAAPA